MLDSLIYYRLHCCSKGHFPLNLGYEATSTFVSLVYMFEMNFHKLLKCTLGKFFVPLMHLPSGKVKQEGIFIHLRVAENLCQLNHSFRIDNLLHGQVFFSLEAFVWCEIRFWITKLRAICSHTNIHCSRA
jgi:hypothetical protein